MSEYQYYEFQSIDRPLNEEEIKYLLVAKDPNDEKDIIIEIRAGAGVPSSNSTPKARW